MMPNKNLPALNFEVCFLKLYEGAKSAPSLYIKEKSLSEARKIKNIAIAMEANEIACQAGKLVCLIERDIAESNPAIPKKDTGRGHKKSIAPGATLSKDKLFHIRQAYKNLSEGEVCQRADDVIQSGEIPTRELFLRRGELAKSAPRVLAYDGHFEYYTPPEIIELARKTMGSIDLDPCSNKYAQKYIKAKEFFTEKDDGLNKEWFGNVWLNPPYVYKKVGEWVDKLIYGGEVKRGIILTNNNTETIWGQSLLTWCNAICFPSGRIKFWNRDGQNPRGPLQGQMILGFCVDPKTFCDNFRPLGYCLGRPLDFFENLRVKGSGQSAEKNKGC